MPNPVDSLKDRFKHAVARTDGERPFRKTVDIGRFLMSPCATNGWLCLCIPKQYMECLKRTTQVIPNAGQCSTLRSLKPGTTFPKHDQIGGARKHD